MKKPTIAELVSVVQAYNEAHRLHLQYPPEIRRQKNVLLDELYVAAAQAARTLAKMKFTR